MRPTRTTCSPASEAHGIPAAAGHMFVRAAIWHVFRPDAGRNDCPECASSRRVSVLRPVSHGRYRLATHRCRTRERHGPGPPFAVLSAQPFATSDRLRGAAMAALEHRIAATPLLPREWSIWATSARGVISWFGTSISTGPNQRIWPRRAGRRTWCAHSRAMARSSCERPPRRVDYHGLV